MILPNIVPIKMIWANIHRKTRLNSNGRDTLFSLSLMFFSFLFCMLASHDGEVALRDKLHFFAPSLLPPTAAKGVHASLEVSAYARTLGV